MSCFIARQKERREATAHDSFQRRAAEAVRPKENDIHHHNYDRRGAHMRRNKLVTIRNKCCQVVGAVKLGMKSVRSWRKDRDSKDPVFSSAQETGVRQPRPRTSECPISPPKDTSSTNRARVGSRVPTASPRHKRCIWVRQLHFLCVREVHDIHGYTWSRVPE